MSKPFSLSRRTLLQGLGSLTLSFAVPLEVAIAQAPAKLPGDLNTSPMLSAWLRINADGTVTLMIGKVELGQGILTAVSQICADELDVDIGRIKIISGDTAVVPNEGVTAGSQSMPGCAPAVQHASAEVRQILLGLAATKFGQPAETLRVSDGTITSPDGGKATYWELRGARSSSARRPGRFP